MTERPGWRDRLLSAIARLVDRGDALVRDAERGCQHALAWCGFINLTVASVVVMLTVAGLLLIGRTAP